MQIFISLICDGKECDNIEISRTVLEDVFDAHAEVTLIKDAFEKKSNDAETAMLRFFSEHYDKIIEELLERYEDEIVETLATHYEDELYEIKYYREVYPCGFFPDPDFFAPDPEEAFKVFKQENIVDAKLKINGQNLTVFGMDINWYLFKAVENAIGNDELNSANTGFVIEKYLNEFVEKGIWHIGLINDNQKLLIDRIEWPEAMVRGNRITWSKNGIDYNPIIWFGLDGESPISCWSLTRERNYITALSDGDYFPYYNWEVLFDGNGGSIIDWAFIEAWDSGPSPEKIIETCPIKFFVEDVAEFVAKLQKGQLFKVPVQSESIVEDGILIKYPKDNQEIFLPEGVTKIGALAFAGSNIEKCILPAGITEIGFNAFRNCERLEEVILPPTVRQISKFAFCNCINLRKITLPDSIKNIEESAFRGCRSLRNLTIPAEIEWINDGTFKGCESLEKIYIPGRCNIVTTAFDYDRKKDCKIIRSDIW